MQLIKSALVTIITFLYLFSSGQSIIQDKDNEFDKKYTPSQNSLFNNLNKKNNQSSNSSSIEIKNSVKYCPTILLRQKVVFFYERQVSNGLSINFGIGKAFGKDFMEQVYLSGFSELYTPNTLSAGDIQQAGAYYGSTALISVGMRLYYSGKSFDGGFVDLNFRRETMKFLLPDAINGYPILGSKTANFKTNTFSFGFGHTFVGGQKNNITHELFTNFGIKLITYSRYNEVPSNNPSSYTSNQYVRASTDLTTRILPAVNFGYVFGFGF